MQTLVVQNMSSGLASLHKILKDGTRRNAVLLLNEKGALSYTDLMSGLGLTAPKYFEVSLKADQNGVMVHTEGWISSYDVSERSFSDRRMVSGSIPRRKGWKVISNLWNRLRTL